ncbi:hypothetical protein ABB27_03030 [Stenotrophomonas terrae]|uniref:Uncharacterized protein n=1 Tax=Stenotrophomonas terrae TaxID=405446 RepID=A0A0R0D253_9GAMM|nr:hypothetical protein ABB27_03030 [Stenotrophomonas terrae]
MSVGSVAAEGDPVERKLEQRQRQQQQQQQQQQEQEQEQEQKLPLPNPPLCCAQGRGLEQKQMQMPKAGPLPKTKQRRALPALFQFVPHARPRRRQPGRERLPPA